MDNYLTYTLSIDPPSYENVSHQNFGSINKAVFCSNSNDIPEKLEYQGEISKINSLSISDLEVYTSDHEIVKPWKTKGSSCLSETVYRTYSYSWDPPSYQDVENWLKIRKKLEDINKDEEVKDGVDENSKPFCEKTSDSTKNSESISSQLSNNNDDRKEMSSPILTRRKSKRKLIMDIHMDDLTNKSSKFNEQYDGSQIVVCRNPELDSQNIQGLEEIETVTDKGMLS